jgi:glycosyltransferase involved in cell wall biosynthesis
VRILVLSKRQYMGKDLLDDRYGRFYELPLHLARLGHEVHGLCASYRARPEGEVIAAADGAEVRWQALNVPPWSAWALRHWLQGISEAVREKRIDLVWACSDAFHALAGVSAQQRLGRPCIVDLYDNFESYGASRIPGVRTLLRRALGRAAGVTCISPALEGHVRETSGQQTNAMVLENGISAEFAPHPRAQCRSRFSLPLDAEVVGTAGALSPQRGVEALFAAFLRLAEQRPKLRLLLAGRVSGLSLPRHPRVSYLGELPLAEVPYVFGAMDVAVVCNKRSAFGDFCFPQKLYEILACGVPPLVAETPGVAPLLAPWPRHRYAPGAEVSLAQALAALLDRPELPGIEPKSWRQHAVTLSAFCESVGRQWGRKGAWGSHAA